MKRAGMCLVVGLVLASGAAHGYVLSRSGWSGTRVRLEVDPSLRALFPSAGDALRQAAAAWRLPRVPRVQLQDSRYALPREAGDHHSVVAVYAQRWPLAPQTLAMAVVTRDPNDNSINEADVYVNAEHHAFADTASGGGEAAEVFDLQSTLTHELGHALGLGDERQVLDATMFFSQRTRDAHKRVPAPDDRRGMAKLYPRPFLPDWGCAGAGVPGAGVPLPLLLLLLLAWTMPRRFRRTGLAGLLLLLLAPAQARAPEAELPELLGLASHGAAALQGVVEHVETLPRDGLPLPRSRLHLRESSCVAGDCSTRPVSTPVVWGGVLPDGRTVELGASPLPRPGDGVLLLVDDEGSVPAAHGLALGFLGQDAAGHAVVRPGNPAAPPLPLAATVASLRHSLGNSARP